MPGPVISILHKFIEFSQSYRKLTHGLEEDTSAEGAQLAPVGDAVCQRLSGCVAFGPEPSNAGQVAQPGAAQFPGKSVSVLFPAVHGARGVDLLAGAQLSLSCQSPTSSGFGAGTGEQVEGPYLLLTERLHVCTPDVTQKL